MMVGFLVLDTAPQGNLSGITVLVFPESLILQYGGGVPGLRHSFAVKENCYAETPESQTPLVSHPECSMVVGCLVLDTAPQCKITPWNHQGGVAYTLPSESPRVQYGGGVPGPRHSAAV